MRIKKQLIAPCGMNCATCLGYLRKKNKCLGCRAMDAYESSYGRKCIIRSCHILKKKNMRFCSDQCEKYPCQRLKNLDKRYRKKYGMSMIENLEYIRDHGIRKFIQREQKRWIKGDKIYCVHTHTYCSYAKK